MARGRHAERKARHDALLPSRETVQEWIDTHITIRPETPDEQAARDAVDEAALAAQADALNGHDHTTDDGLTRRAWPGDRWRVYRDIEQTSDGPRRSWFAEPADPDVYADHRTTTRRFRFTSWRGAYGHAITRAYGR